MLPMGFSLASLITVSSLVKYDASNAVFGPRRTTPDGS